MLSLKRQLVYLNKQTCLPDIYLGMCTVLHTEENWGQWFRLGVLGDPKNRAPTGFSKQKSGVGG